MQEIWGPVIKGIILAGGRGTRLWPVTSVVVKQLLPIYDKPMIYYPLATLMSAQITDIAIICNPKDIDLFQNLLGDGSQIGIRLTYIIQKEPRGIAEAFILARDFISKSSVALILGDNLFHGPGLGRNLQQYADIQGAQVFAYRVNNPEEYGVINFDTDGVPISIEEKPTEPRSNFAIPGLYFFDNQVVDFAAELNPSKRGELEITDIMRAYLRKKILSASLISRGAVWLDTGTVDSLQAASVYVQVIEQRQGFKIGCIEEIAFKNGWISENEIRLAIKQYGDCSYAQYLQSFLQNQS
jgi:glucose-1-phosphate thymidylyltransferase